MHKLLAVLAAFSVFVLAAVPAMADPPSVGTYKNATGSYMQGTGVRTLNQAAIAETAFTTPAGTTAYASGQLIANSATAGSVAPLQFTVCAAAGLTGMVRRARIKTTDTGFVGATVRLHLYKSSPTVTNGDHGTFSSTESNWLDDVDVILDHAFSDPLEKGIGVPAHGSEIDFDCNSTVQTIYGLVEARGAITPQGAKLMTVTLETLPN